MKFLKALLYIAAIVTLAAISSLAIHVQRDMDATAAQIAATTQQINVTLTKLDPVLVDAKRDVEIAGGLINVARDELRDQQANVKLEGQAILTTTNNVNDLVTQASKTLQNMDDNSAKSMDELTKALEAVPPMLQQTQSTIAKTEETVDSINQVVQGPVMGTMNNLQNTTKTIDSYVKRITTPRGFLSTLFRGMLGMTQTGAAVATAAK